MASTFSTDLKLELMATGENAGTWGDKTNSNLNLVQQAIAGYEAIALSDGGTVTLAMTEATLSNARNMILKFTGTLTTASIVTIPDGIEKFYIIDLSAVTGVTNLTIKTASGTGFTAGEAKIVAAYSDATNLIEIALDTLGGTIATSQLTGTIATAQISDNAITTAKISDNQITTAKISDNQITTAKISDNQITTAKISDNQVTAAKLDDVLTDSGGTAGAYTTVDLTVDAQGRITAIATGSSGTAIPTFALNVNGPASGTYTAGPAATDIFVFAAGGGGGGCGESYNFIGGDGGKGGIGLFKKAITAPYSVPYSVGGGGSGSNSESPAPSGGSTTLNSTDAVANGGAGGNRPQGTVGSAGGTGATNLIYNVTGSPGKNADVNIARVYYGATGPTAVGTYNSTVISEIGLVASSLPDLIKNESLTNGGSRGGGYSPGNPGQPGKITIFEVS
jgi:hypothetical protein